MQFNTLEERKNHYRTKAYNDIESLATKHNEIIVCLPTGYGKTLVSIKLYEKFSKGKSFLFLVPETPLIQNAKDDFIKHGREDLLQYGTFACYASTKNFVGHTFDMIIADEVHNAVSDLRIEALIGINHTRFVGLSATLTEEQVLTLLKVAPFEMYIKTLDEGINEGVLAKPVIKEICIDLDDSVKRNKYAYGKKEVMLTDRGYYNVLSASITHWRELYEVEGKPFQANKMKAMGAQRQRFLADCKEPYVKALIKNLGESRFICFCGSVDQALRLGDNVCSSKKTKKGNDQLIKDFNSFVINSLFAKDMLKEGTNLVATNYGILIQPGNSEKDFIQMLGRTLRSDNPTFYIFRANNTVDDRFLKNSMRQLNNG